MIMVAHNNHASRKGDAHHLFPSYQPHARAITLNPEIRDAHQEIVMRNAGPSGYAWRTNGSDSLTIEGRRSAKKYTCGSTL